ncbi:unnamed protein product [Phaeothamnion confervicola]
MKSCCMPARIILAHCLDPAVCFESATSCRRAALASLTAAVCSVASSEFCKHRPRISRCCSLCRFRPPPSPAPNDGRSERPTVLRYVREEGCPWDESCCSSAGEHGRLDALQFARLHHCPWDDETCSESRAAGHSDVVAWAHANGCPCDCLLHAAGGVDGGGGADGAGDGDAADDAGAGGE